jgi:acyl carrier protein
MGLDTIEFVMAAEKEFGLQLPENEVSLIYTVGEFTNLIHQKLLAKHGLHPCPSSDVVFDKIKALLVKEQGLSEHKIQRTSRFVQDLRMD